MAATCLGVTVSSSTKEHLYIKQGIQIDGFAESFFLNAEIVDGRVGTIFLDRPLDMPWLEPADLLLFAKFPDLLEPVVRFIEDAVKIASEAEVGE